MRWLRWLAATLAAVALMVVAAVVYLATLDLNAYKGEIEAALQDTVGQPVEIRGPLRLEWSWPTPSVTASDVRVANAAWGSEPAMATIESLLVHIEMRPLLAGAVKVDRLALSRARLLLERGPDGQGNWKLLGASDADRTEGSGGEHSVRRIELSDSTVAWKRRPDAEPHLYRIGDLQLDGGGRTSPFRIRLSGELTGEPVALTGEVPALSTLLDPGSAGPLDLRGTLGGMPVALSGRLAVEPGSDGSIERLTLADLAVAYDGVRATGSAALEFGGEGARLVADLSSEEVDLGRFAGAGDKAGDPLERRLPLDLLPAIDGEVKVAIARLVSGRWTFEDVTATATLDRGKLTLDPVKARVAGGAVWARGSVDTGVSPAALTLVGSGEGLDMAKFYRALVDEGLIEGKGDAVADLEATGDTPRALLASLRGAARLVVGEGVILNKYWELIAADLATEFVPFATNGERGRLNCMVGRFEIKKGLADARVLMIDSDRVLVGGAGTVRLADQRLDMRLVPQAKDPGVVSLAVPILLKGTIRDPQVSPDPISVATGLGAIATGAMIAPLAALLPFVSGGSVDKPCPAAIAVAEGRKPPQGAPVRSRDEQKKPGGIKGLFEGLRKAIE